MQKNYFITDDYEQNKNTAEQTVQLYSNGVVLFASTHSEFEIPIITVISLFGYENQTYCDLGIENDLLNTGAVFCNFLLPFTYALSNPSTSYSENDNLFYLRNALQKQGHYARVI